MKIGIITVQKAPNYGAEMQCYALYKALINMGYDCEVIDLCRPYHKDFIKDRRYKIYNNISRWTFKYYWVKTRPIRSWIKEHIFGKKNYLKDFNKQYQVLLQNRNIKFERFESRIAFTRKYCSIADLYKNPPQYDVYITGSDQLWNPTQPYCLEPYFLTFVNNGGKRISYATSIGVSILRDNVKNDFRKWLASYDKISVREDAAKMLLKPLTHKEIEVLADPTFLIDIDHWKDIAVKPVERGYVFLFTLGYEEQLFNKAQQYAKSEGKKLIYRANDYRDYPSCNDSIGLLEMSPEEWLGYICYADMVVTNSFHGSVFSILFHKPFRVISTNNRGSRIHHLLELCGCKECYLTADEPVTDVTINYQKIDEVILKERKRAELYLSDL